MDRYQFRMLAGIIFIVSMFTFSIWFIANSGVVTTEKEGIITDMWIKTVSALGSKTVYMFEINNESAISVSDFDYYNHEIGDSYFWSEKEYRHPFME